MEKIGNILMECGVIDPAQKSESLRYQEEAETPVGEILMSLGHIEENDLLLSLSYQLNIPFIPCIFNEDIDFKTLRSIPDNFIKEHHIFPLKSDGTYRLAMADPLNLFAYDDVQKLVPAPLKRVIVPAAEIMRVCGELLELNAA